MNEATCPACHEACWEDGGCDAMKDSGLFAAAAAFAKDLGSEKHARTLVEAQERLLAATPHPTRSPRGGVVTVRSETTDAGVIEFLRENVDAAKTAPCRACGAPGPQGEGWLAVSQVHDIVEAPDEIALLTGTICPSCAPAVLATLGPVEVAEVAEGAGP